TSRTIYLPENGETPFGVTDERDIHFRAHQIIAGVKFGHARGRLRQGKAGKVNRSQKGQAEIAFAVKTAVRPQIVFAENFDSDLIVRAQHVAGGCRDGLRGDAWTGRGS